MVALLGVAALAVGVFFTAIGVLGNIRLPDVFTRLHATSKVSSVGILGLALASALLVPSTAPKAVALGLLVLFSAPVASQAIARSGYRDGCAMIGLERNDIGVVYIDFPYDYTIGAPVPWEDDVAPAPEA
ncbi:MAG TPA: monovalent cation/H(+) antiporter subunit G [Euzebyales bacterium]|nr:monovalent cation/H(+) antiporter subunit G [Euzebyales bacterium]